MKRIFKYCPVALLILLSCVGDKPLSQYEATDEEAIFNVVTIDNGRLSEFRILSLDIPDTLEFMENPDSAHSLHWHVVDSTEEDFRVTISNQPVQSPVGLVDQGSATLTKIWRGFFETFRYNAQADSLERYSREFELTGTRNAVCQKWGQSSRRRGWLLTSIGAARFTSAGSGQPFLNNLVYDTQSNADQVFQSGILELADIAHFDGEEEITIRFSLSDETDFLEMLIPVDNFRYELASPSPIPSGGYQVTLIMPSISRIYGQLSFLVVNGGDYSGDYLAAGYSYPYRIR